MGDPAETAREVLAFLEVRFPGDWPPARRAEYQAALEGLDPERLPGRVVALSAGRGGRCPTPAEIVADLRPAEHPARLSEGSRALLDATYAFLRGKEQDRPRDRAVYVARLRDLAVEYPEHAIEIMRTVHFLERRG